MPNRIPSHCRHRASGKGVVRLDGRDYYTGTWGTKAAEKEYKRLVNRWTSGGLSNGADDLTIGELAAKYWSFVVRHYQKGGAPTSAQACIRCALRPLLALYENEQAADFGPKALKAVRNSMVEEGQCRTTANCNVGRIRRMFKWAVAEELVPVEIYSRLCTVQGLQRGRTQAREKDPVAPVTDEQIERTLPHLTRTVADMVLFQRLTGCRPAEVCQLRPYDIDRTGDVWTYRPQSHKTEHHGRQRTILIGPKAQAILLRYLARDPEMYCFRPIDSEAKRRAAATEARKTPLSCGNKPGTHRKRRPQRTPSDRYVTTSYARAITRACDRAAMQAAMGYAFGPLPNESVAKWYKRQTGISKEIIVAHLAKFRWSPNMLRHSAATQIRSQFGLEEAQIILGHAKADITETYAERDLAKGLAVARLIG
jgi:integrase